ncbi:MAG: hypothetical protein CMG46_00660 [Candidatus Marinimicrobia bacterium]|nr:hypothetical protein [Candidatus Neomarinimicrobiota bacterium]
MTSRAATLDECKELCNNTDDCVAINVFYHPASPHCMLYRQGNRITYPTFSQPGNPNFRCYRNTDNHSVQESIDNWYVDRVTANPQLPQSQWIPPADQSPGPPSSAGEARMIQAETAAAREAARALSYARARDLKATLPVSFIENGINPKPLCTDDSVWRYNDRASVLSCADFVAAPGLGAENCEAAWAEGIDASGASVLPYFACQVSCPATATDRNCGSPVDVLNETLSDYTRNFNLGVSLQDLALGPRPAHGFDCVSLPGHEVYDSGRRGNIIRDPNMDWQEIGGPGVYCGLDETSLIPSPESERVPGAGGSVSHQISEYSRDYATEELCKDACKLHPECLAVSFGAQEYSSLTRGDMRTTPICYFHGKVYDDEYHIPPPITTTGIDLPDGVNLVTDGNLATKCHVLKGSDGLNEPKENEIYNGVEIDIGTDGDFNESICFHTCMVERYNRENVSLLPNREDGRVLFSYNPVNGMCQCNYTDIAEPHDVPGAADYLNTYQCTYKPGTKGFLENRENYLKNNLANTYFTPSTLPWSSTQENMDSRIDEIMIRNRSERESNYVSWKSSSGSSSAASTEQDELREHLKEKTGLNWRNIYYDWETIQDLSDQYCHISNPIASISRGGVGSTERLWSQCAVDSYNNIQAPLDSDNNLLVPDGSGVINPESLNLQKQGGECGDGNVSNIGFYKDGNPRLPQCSAGVDHDQSENCTIVHDNETSWDFFRDVGVNNHPESIYVEIGDGGWSGMSGNYDIYPDRQCNGRPVYKHRYGTKWLYNIEPHGRWQVISKSDGIDEGCPSHPLHMKCNQNTPDDPLPTDCPAWMTWSQDTGVGWIDEGSVTFDNVTTGQSNSEKWQYDIDKSICQWENDVTISGPFFSEPDQPVGDAPDSPNICKVGDSFQEIMRNGSIGENCGMANNQTECDNSWSTGLPKTANVHVPNTHWDLVIRAGGSYGNTHFKNHKCKWTGSNCVSWEAANWRAALMDLSRRSCESYIGDSKNVTLNNPLRGDGAESVDMGERAVEKIRALRNDRTISLDGGTQSCENSSSISQCHISWLNNLSNDSTWNIPDEYVNADGTVKGHRCQWDYMDGTCKSWINSPNTLQICDRVEGTTCKNTDYLLPSEKIVNEELAKGQNIKRNSRKYVVREVGRWNVEGTRKNGQAMNSFDNVNIYGLLNGVYEIYDQPKCIEPDGGNYCSDRDEGACSDDDCEWESGTPPSPLIQGCQSIVSDCTFTTRDPQSCTNTENCVYTAPVNEGCGFRGQLENICSSYISGDSSSCNESLCIYQEQEDAICRAVPLTITLSHPDSGAEISQSQAEEWESTAPTTCLEDPVMIGGSPQCLDPLSGHGDCQLVPYIPESCTLKFNCDLEVGASGEANRAACEDTPKPTIPAGLDNAGLSACEYTAQVEESCTYVEDQLCTSSPSLNLSEHLCLDAGNCEFGVPPKEGVCKYKRDCSQYENQGECIARGGTGKCVWSPENYCSDDTFGYNYDSNIGINDKIRDCSKIKDKGLCHASFEDESGVKKKCRWDERNLTCDVYIERDGKHASEDLCSVPEANYNPIYRNIVDNTYVNYRGADELGLAPGSDRDGPKNTFLKNRVIYNSDEISNEISNLGVTLSGIERIDGVGGVWWNGDYILSDKRCSGSPVYYRSNPEGGDPFYGTSTGEQRILYRQGAQPWRFTIAQNLVENNDGTCSDIGSWIQSTQCTDNQNPATCNWKEWGGGRWVVGSGTVDFHQHESGETILEAAQRINRIKEDRKNRWVLGWRDTDSLKRSSSYANSTSSAGARGSSLLLNTRQILTGSETGEIEMADGPHLPFLLKNTNLDEDKKCRINIENCNRAIRVYEDGRYHSKPNVHENIYLPYSSQISWVDSGSERMNNYLEIEVKSDITLKEESENKAIYIVHGATLFPEMNGIYVKQPNIYCGSDENDPTLRRPVWKNMNNSSNYYLQQIRYSKEDAIIDERLRSTEGGEPLYDGQWILKKRVPDTNSPDDECKVGLQENVEDGTAGIIEEKLTEVCKMVGPEDPTCRGGMVVYKDSAFQVETNIRFTPITYDDLALEKDTSPQQLFDTCQNIIISDPNTYCKGPFGEHQCNDFMEWSNLSSNECIDLDLFIGCTDSQKQERRRDIMIMSSIGLPWYATPEEINYNERRIELGLGPPEYGWSVDVHSEMELRESRIIWGLGPDSQYTPRPWTEDITFELNRRKDIVRLQFPPFTHGDPDRLIGNENWTSTEDITQEEINLAEYANSKGLLSYFHDGYVTTDIDVDIAFVWKSMQNIRNPVGVVGMGGSVLDTFEYFRDNIEYWKTTSPPVGTAIDARVADMLLEMGVEAYPIDDQHPNRVRIQAFTEIARRANNLQAQRIPATLRSLASSPFVGYIYNDPDRFPNSLYIGKRYTSDEILSIWDSSCKNPDNPDDITQIHLCMAGRCEKRHNSERTQVIEYTCRCSESAQGSRCEDPIPGTCYSHPYGNIYNPPPETPLTGSEAVAARSNPDNYLGGMNESYLNNCMARTNCEGRECLCSPGEINCNTCIRDGMVKVPYIIREDPRNHYASCDDGYPSAEDCNNRWFLRPPSDEDIVEESAGRRSPRERMYKCKWSDSRFRHSGARGGRVVDYGHCYPAFLDATVTGDSQRYCEPLEAGNEQKESCIITGHQCIENPLCIVLARGAGVRALEVPESGEWGTDTNDTTEAYCINGGRQHDRVVDGVFVGCTSCRCPDGWMGERCELNTSCNIDDLNAYRPVGENTSIECESSPSNWPSFRVDYHTGDWVGGGVWESVDPGSTVVNQTRCRPICSYERIGYMNPPGGSTLMPAGAIHNNYVCDLGEWKNLEIGPLRYSGTNYYDNINNAPRSPASREGTANPACPASSSANFYRSNACTQINYCGTLSDGTITGTCVDLNTINSIDLSSVTDNESQMRNQMRNFIDLNDGSGSSSEGRYACYCNSGYKMYNRNGEFVTHTATENEMSSITPSSQDMASGRVNPINLSTPKGCVYRICDSDSLNRVLPTGAVWITPECLDVENGRSDNIDTSTICEYTCNGERYSNIPGSHNTNKFRCNSEGVMVPDTSHCQNIVSSGLASEREANIVLREQCSASSSIQGCIYQPICSDGAEKCTAVIDPECANVALDGNAATCTDVSTATGRPCNYTPAVAQTAVVESCVPNADFVAMAAASSHIASPDCTTGYIPGTVEAPSTTCPEMRTVHGNNIRQCDFTPAVAQINVDEACTSSVDPECENVVLDGTSATCTDAGACEYTAPSSGQCETLGYKPRADYETLTCGDAGLGATCAATENVCTGRVLDHNQGEKCEGQSLADCENFYIKNFKHGNLAPPGGNYGDYFPDVKCRRSWNTSTREQMCLPYSLSSIGYGHVEQLSPTRITPCYPHITDCCEMDLCPNEPPQGATIDQGAFECTPCSSPELDGSIQSEQIWPSRENLQNGQIECQSVRCEDENKRADPDTLSCVDCPFGKYTRGDPEATSCTADTCKLDQEVTGGECVDCHPYPLLLPTAPRERGPMVGTPLTSDYGEMGTLGLCLTHTSLEKAEEIIRLYEEGYISHEQMNSLNEYIYLDNEIKSTFSAEASSRFDTILDGVRTDYEQKITDTTCNRGTWDWYNSLQDGTESISETHTIAQYYDEGTQTCIDCSTDFPICPDNERVSLCNIYHGNKCIECPVGKYNTSDMNPTEECTTNLSLLESQVRNIIDSEIFISRETCQGTIMQEINFSEGDNCGTDSPDEETCNNRWISNYHHSSHTPPNIPAIEESCTPIIDEACTDVELNGTEARCTGAGNCSYTASLEESCSSDEPENTICASVTLDGNPSTCTSAAADCNYTTAVPESCTATINTTCADVVLDGSSASARWCATAGCHHVEASEEIIHSPGDVYPNMKCYYDGERVVPSCTSFPSQDSPILCNDCIRYDNQCIDDALITSIMGGEDSEEKLIDIIHLANQLSVCPDGEWYNIGSSSENKCEACTDYSSNPCPDGTYETGCSQYLNNTCTPCTVYDEHALRYTCENESSTVSLTCNEGYYIQDDICTPCQMDGVHESSTIRCDENGNNSYFRSEYIDNVWIFEDDHCIDGYLYESVERGSGRGACAECETPSNIVNEEDCKAIDVLNNNHVTLCDSVSLDGTEARCTGAGDGSICRYIPVTTYTCSRCSSTAPCINSSNTRISHCEDGYWKDETNNADICVPCTPVDFARDDIVPLCSHSNNSRIPRCQDGYWKDGTGDADICVPSSIASCDPGFRYLPGTSSQDSECIACSETEYISETNHTLTGCNTLTELTCGDGEYISTLLNPNEPYSSTNPNIRDRICSPCLINYYDNSDTVNEITDYTGKIRSVESCNSDGGEKVLLGDCSDGYFKDIGAGYEIGNEICRQWSNCEPTEYISNNGLRSSDIDTECTALTECSEGTYESIAPTEISDKGCSPCPPITNSYSYLLISAQILCDNDGTNSRVNRCQDGFYLDDVDSDGYGRNCSPCTPIQNAEPGIITLCDEGDTNHRIGDCPIGMELVTGGDVSSCLPITCGINQHVVDNTCVDCPAGLTNEAGDNASDEDTTCNPILCGLNQYVFNHECLDCPPGTTNPVGDIASGPDTYCSGASCLINQYVKDNACVNCPPGTTNPAGDTTIGEDTSCETVLCEINQYVLNNQCVDCPSGSNNEAGDDSSGQNTTCESVICTEPLVKQGYNVINNELNVSRGFNVTVSCNSEYKSIGSGPTAIPCITSGPYQLSGCIHKNVKLKEVTLTLSGNYNTLVGAKGSTTRITFEANFKTDLVNLLNSDTNIQEPVTVEQITIIDIQPGSIKVKFTINNNIKNHEISRNLNRNTSFPTLGIVVQSPPIIKVVKDKGINYKMIGGGLAFLLISGIVLYFLLSSTGGSNVQGGIMGVGQPTLPPQIAYR